jgi:hypothetical protein
VEYVEFAQILCGTDCHAAKIRNISLGGMLLESDLSLNPGARVRVCFQLPDGRAMNPHARVVHCRSSVRLGIEFTELEEYERTALSNFIQVEESAKRRSIRLPLRLYLRLGWGDAEGMREESAESILVSRHGCLILTRDAPEPNGRLLLFWPEKNAHTEARVVWRRKESEEWFLLALEFCMGADFWGINF